MDYVRIGHQSSSNSCGVLDQHDKSFIAARYMLCSNAVTNYVCLSQEQFQSSHECKQKQNNCPNEHMIITRYCTCSSNSAQDKDHQMNERLKETSFYQSGEPSQTLDHSRTNNYREKSRSGNYDISYLPELKEDIPNSKHNSDINTSCSCVQYYKQHRIKRDMIVDSAEENPHLNHDPKCAFPNMEDDLKLYNPNLILLEPGCSSSIKTCNNRPVLNDFPCHNSRCVNSNHGIIGLKNINKDNDIKFNTNQNNTFSDFNSKDTNERSGIDLNKTEEPCSKNICHIIVPSDSNNDTAFNEMRTKGIGGVPKINADRDTSVTVTIRVPESLTQVNVTDCGYVSHSLAAALNVHKINNSHICEGI